VAKDLRGLKVVDHRMVHLSAVRNCHLVRLVTEEEQSRSIFFVNTHLHHVIEDDAIRKHEAF
jgi:hypothetical protein